MNNIATIQHIGGLTSSLPFSPGIWAGDFLFLSGLASVNERGEIINDTFENEARRTYQNILRVLTRANLTFSDVVQVRCYLSEKKDWEAHNRIYREFFREPFPARTTLIGCLGEMVKYEVELIAYKPKRENTKQL